MKVIKCNDRTRNPLILLMLWKGRDLSFICYILELFKFLSGKNLILSSYIKIKLIEECPL